MRRARTFLFVVVVLASVVLGIRATYLNLQGRPQWGTSVALGITILMFFLLGTWPALRPRRPPAITVTFAGAAPGQVYGRDEAGFEYTHDAQGNVYRYVDNGVPQWVPPEPLPPRWWNWPARGVVVATWLVRSALAGYVAYFVAEEVHRGFNLTLLQSALAVQVLTLLRRVAESLSGFRLDWTAYRGWGGVRRLVNAAVITVLGGYAFVVADFLDAVLFAVPRFIYRGLDSVWHAPWLNVPIVVVACVIVAIMVTIVVRWIQRGIVRVLGPDSALGAKLDELKIITWHGDPRLLWRRRRHW